MIRAGALLWLLCNALPAPADVNPPATVQAVEFPYYLYPRPVWERELVWLKNIGVDTVAFTIPAPYHQTASGTFDLTGSTSPRRDLLGLIRLLRKLGLHAWIRPVTPAAGMVATTHDPAEQRAWLKQLEQLLAPQTVAHGGPIAYVEGRGLGLDAAVAPAPITTLSATDPNALARSREALRTARGALLWTDVEDMLYPAGWSANPSTLLRKGAVALGGEERTHAVALRRSAALLRSWGHLLGAMRPANLPAQAAGKLPEGVSAYELISPAGSAVSLSNLSRKPFQGELRVLDPVTRHTLAIPGVNLAAGQSLWLPVGVSLGPDGLCRDCTKFAAPEHIVYATAELLSIEFENGILAMEFAAPEAGEAILQLERRPVGPFLAAGVPTSFDWDETHLRARLRIPASKQADSRVRIGIAIEAPETSGFFNDLHRLVIGRKNLVSTMYSSPDLAARSRLRLPEGYSATPVVKSPNEIDFEIAVPPESVPGDFANLSLEADGAPLGRARVPLFRDATVRVGNGLQLHYGQAAELAPEPAVVAIEGGGGNLEVAIRNNTLQIQTYRLQPAGAALEFLPAQAEISIAPTDERRVEFRAFPAQGAAGNTGLREASVRVTGGAEATLPVRILPVRILPVPRGATVCWSADLDGDGTPEWILESAKVRAVFSTQDGGRWIEFTWKDTGANFLPETGLFAQAGEVEVRAAGDALEFTGKGWKRTVTLNATALTIQQSTALPAELPPTGKRGNLTLTVERDGAMRAVFTLR